MLGGVAHFAKNVDDRPIKWLLLGKKRKKELWVHSLTNIIDLFCKPLVITRDFYFKIC
jgi:hypothetical protein